MNDQPQIAPAEVTADDLYATIDELRAQNESLSERAVLLNKEVRLRDHRIQLLSAQLAEQAGMKETDEPELKAVSHDKA